ncbi:MAG: family 43 glycosylhydrolase [Sphaerochaetaceae bacterium]|nr:family 43 glycosylhydrolase [Sphaerochaetaceae bacterium]
MKELTAEQRKRIAVFKKIDEKERNRTVVSKPHHQSSICPGKEWLDTDGRKIEAHGGSVYYEDGLYYWYGENKEYTDTKNKVWTWGMKMYSSSDLYNWDYRGYIIYPVIDDPSSSIYPTKKVDRPHILKCPSTGKYVCWIKLCGEDACFTIFEAPSITGPYTMVREYYRPAGHRAGDFDMVEDKESGKAYLFFDADHNSLLCMEMAEDYLSAEKQVCSNYTNSIRPFTREAPCAFERGDKKYLISSCMTGYAPNRSDWAVSDRWDEEFKSMGSPHLNDKSDASFNSQIAKVFRVEGTDKYIAMADRWISYIRIDASLADIIRRVTGSKYRPDLFSCTKEEEKKIYLINHLESVNTSLATYVWLPVQWKDDRPFIEWKDEWTI